MSSKTTEPTLPQALDANADEAYAALTALTDAQEAQAQYGGLREGLHIAGYAFERALFKLEWLLTDGRWREVGSGFHDVNAFLDSLHLGDLRMVAEERKKVARRIKELTAKASNRSIARALGVSHQTVYDDLSSRPGVKKLTRQRQKTQHNQHSSTDKSATATRPAATMAAAKTTARDDITRKPPRDPERRRICREIKLGPEIMQRIAGTSLDTARELDALVYLDQGAPQGGHTEDVKRIVALAEAGKHVSAIEWKKNGVPPPRDDIDRLADGEAGEVGALLRAWGRASEAARRTFMTRVGLTEASPPPADDGLDVPEFLRRGTGAAHG